MNEVTSESTGKRYGVQRVCRAWERARDYGTRAIQLRHGVERIAVEKPLREHTVHLLPDPAPLAVDHVLER